MPDSQKPHPWCDSRAARMLADGLKQLVEREGVSQRQLAKRLGHRQPVMLSHWASGRVPIPVERVDELVEALHLDDRGFLLAVLQQRHPTVDWDVLEDLHTPAYAFVSQLQDLAGVPIEDLEPGQMKVMREAAADPKAARRWLTIHELALVEAIRRVRPEFAEIGVSAHELGNVVSVLSTA